MRWSVWVSTAALVACGGRSSLDVSPADSGHDVTLEPKRDAGLVDDASRDSAPDSSRDGGSDSSHDGGYDSSIDDGHAPDRDGRQDSAHEPDGDASRDAGHEAGHDSGRDAGNCPSTLPSGACATRGEVLACPAGVCTCMDMVGCGTCLPRTCHEGEAHCGAIGDGCGGILQCGTCPPAEMCVQNVCVGLDGGCPPRTCAELGVTCGTVSDGCGGTINCGPCSWFCSIPPPSPCPLMQPTPGAPCSIDADIACTYTGPCCATACTCTKLPDGTPVWKESETCAG